MPMTVTEAVTWICNQASKIFTVRFVKRTDGTVREMTCRLGVMIRKGLADGERAYEPDQKNLIWVYDFKCAQKGEAARRSIPIEGLQAVKIDGQWISVQQPE